MTAGGLLTALGVFALCFVLALAMEEARELHKSLSIGRRLRGCWRALRGQTPNAKLGAPVHDWYTRCGQMTWCTICFQPLKADRSNEHSECYQCGKCGVCRICELTGVKP